MYEYHKIKSRSNNFKFANKVLRIIKGVGHLKRSRNEDENREVDENNNDLEDNFQHLISLLGFSSTCVTFMDFN